MGKIGNRGAKATQLTVEEQVFTSDCAGLTFPLLKREMPVMKVAKMLLLSYLFNFIGAQFIAFVLSANVGLFDKEPWQSYLHHYSEAKVNQYFIRVFVKGIGANWPVCRRHVIGRNGLLVSVPSSSGKKINKHS